MSVPAQSTDVSNCRSSKGLRRFLGRSFLLAVTASAVLAFPASADINLVFGTYAADKPTETVKTFKPFLAYLADEMSENLGERVTISMQIARNYEDGIDDLVSGKVDFARFGPASYVTAKSRNAEISIIAMESKKGKRRSRVLSQSTKTVTSNQ